MADDGLCGECGLFGQCAVTNLGWMCLLCFEEVVKNGPKSANRVYALPPAGAEVFVVMSRNCFVILESTLYTFGTKEEAERLANTVRLPYHLPDARVERMDATVPFAFVMAHPGLKLLGTAKKVDESKLSDPNIAQ